MLPNYMRDREMAADPRRTVGTLMPPTGHLRCFFLAERR